MFFYRHSALLLALLSVGYVLIEAQDFVAYVTGLLLAAIGG